MTGLADDPPPVASGLWNFINQTHITRERLEDLSEFKSSAVNFKIALWNPQTRGLHYLKTLLYQLCASLSADNWQRLSRIPNRNFGTPISIKYIGQEACLDYVQAVLELEFIEKHVQAGGKDILEIGAGYGRSCHAIMSNHPVRSYCIVDLENSLDLARKYLGQVLDQASFNRIHFVLASDFHRLRGDDFHLGININSFAEMDAPVVHQYLRFIEDHCRYLYVKNPVGKYYLDNNPEEDQVVQLARSTGLLRDVIEIYDSQAVAAQAAKFVDVYRPGPAWRCIGSGWAPPWSWYWQALFRNEAGRE